MQVWEDYALQIVPKPSNHQPVALHYEKDVVKQPRILFMFINIS